MTSDKRPPPY